MIVLATIHTMSSGVHSEVYGHECELNWRDSAPKNSTMGPPQELVLPETVTQGVNIDEKGSHGVVTAKRGRNYAREDRSKKSRRAWIGSWAFLSSEHTVRFQWKNHTPGSQILGF